MGKECIIVEGFTFRKDSILKCGEMSWTYRLNAHQTTIHIYKTKNFRNSTQFIHFQIRPIVYFSYAPLMRFLLPH
jgi:hypothetical protein